MLTPMARVAFGGALIDIDAKAGFVIGVHIPVFDQGRAGEHLALRIRKPRGFLNSEMMA